ncbi:MAG TPA: trypsin-like peptidase domain-containing protein [Bauldia sp.]|nr:trypsin-like peptidase domain-containing protein [Bauldia sp.]
MTGRSGLAAAIFCGMSAAWATVPAAGAAPAEGAPALADLVAKVAPSVVYVTATDTSANKVGAFGTGVIVGDGEVLTNAFLVLHGDKLTIDFADGSSADATIAGKDLNNQLAILKVTAPAGTSAATFGSSAALRRGDAVFALGNYASISGMASTGIVADNNAQVDATSARYVASTAGTYPDDRGTPLFDMQGELVGLVAEQLAVGDGARLALATPGDTIKAEIDELAAGDVTHGWLGITIRDATTAEAAKGGVFITAVAPGSPAVEAGLAANDIITAVNGSAVTRAAEVSRSVSGLAAGTKLSLDVSRGGWSKTVEVTLGDLAQARTPPQQPQIGDSAGAAPPAAGGDAGSDFMKEFNKTFGQFPNAPQTPAAGN